MSDGPDPSTLYGLGLAKAAQDVARTLDPQRKGLTAADYQKAIEATGATIYSDARKTITWSLNYSQNRFDRVGRGRWAWKETEETEGLTGEALLDEAYLRAKWLDPEQLGIHHSKVRAAIEADGSKIGGINPGQAVYLVMKNAGPWFEFLGRGTFRWR